MPKRPYSLPTIAKFNSVSELPSHLREIARDLQTEAGALTTVSIKSDTSGFVKVSRTCSRISKRNEAEDV
jgi:hypothetical protein